MKHKPSKMTAKQIDAVQQLKASNAAGTHKNKAKEAQKDNKKAVKQNIAEQ